MFSTKGIDLWSPPQIKRQWGARLLCMQVLQWTGSPLCLHPLGNTFEVVLWKNNLHWKTGSCALVQLGQNLLSEMSFRMSGGTQLGDPAVEVEGEVVRLEFFCGAQGARASGRFRRSSGGRMGRFCLGHGRSVPNWFDPYICRGVVEIKKSWVRLRILFFLVHILGEEQESGKKSDIDRLLAYELHELIIER